MRLKPPITPTKSKKERAQKENHAISPPPTSSRALISRTATTFPEDQKLAPKAAFL